MKGEERFDLKQVLAKHFKSELLVSAYFKEEDLNDVPFRDLYEFFDQPQIGIHCFTEIVRHNERQYWVHNLEREDGTFHGEFKTRKEAEIDMYINAFRLLEEKLNPVPEFYRRSNDTSNKTDWDGESTTILY
jgi:hypothetical protein